MKNIPRLSIVLPVYNGERYLSEAIESIINQTFGDFELIIVNDCSSDETLDIANRFSDIDDRIIVTSNVENSGLPVSLNNGFNISKGEYLTWTSDDNIYHTDALEKMVTYLDSNKECGLVFADMNLIDENGEVIGHRIAENYNIYSKNCVGACFMYRSECKSVIGDYDDSKRLIEDYDYWLRIASFFKFGRIPEILYDYRYHNNSLTVKKLKLIGERLAELRLEYIDKIANSVDEKSYKEIVFEMVVCCENKVLSSIDCSKVIDVDRVVNRKRIISGDRIWLFGAGALGRSALEILSNKEIKGFIDNDTSKVGTEILGKPVLSLKQFEETKNKDSVVISTELRYAYSILNQLYSYGVDNAVLLYDVSY